jgi:hypothetical protein
MDKDCYNENWNTGSAYDFSEIFHEDTEIFYFFSRYLINDYKHFLNKSKKSDNINKKLFSIKITFKENSYQKRVLEVILFSLLAERENTKTDIIRKAQMKFKRGFYFIDEKTFDRLQHWFFMYSCEVKGKSERSLKITMKKKLEDF